MPYIPKDRQRILASLSPREAGYYAGIDAATGTKGTGELTYLLSQVVRGYLKGAGTSYATFAEIAGCLSLLSQEIFRRQIGPYEQTKLEENGDVFDEV